MSDGRKDRWDEHRERRRAEFVAAGLRVLRTDGPDLLMDAVAAEAGVTKPVLYRYFADKAALVEALAEHGLVMIKERVIPPILADGPAMARVRGGVGAYFAFVDENPELYRLIIRQGNTEGAWESSAVTRLRESIATTLTAIYGDYLRAFGLDTGAAEPWGYGITGLVRSTAEWWLERRSMSRAYVTEYVSQLIWSALTGVLHEAGIRPDPNAQVPSGRPLLTLRTGERAAGPKREQVTGAAPAPLPEHVRVAVIGAGFSGLGAGIRLRQAGRTDFVILERAASVGGTWRDNTYPGCTCDIPSHLYSFSFAPNPAWSHSFSRQPEIRSYLTHLSQRHQLAGHLHFGTEVSQARWEAGAARWRLHTSRGELTADVLIAAAGPLSEPSLPDIPGLAEFPGPVFHSARWDHQVSLAGLRVAVVGTGASAVQIVPAIQPTVARLMLFQRTPAWVMPRQDRQISAAEKWLYRRVPPAQRLVRAGLHASREALVVGFVRQPGLLRAAQRISRRHLARAVPDPALRAKLTPEYVLGCKRVLLSNDFYPALTQPNAELVASGLARVDGRTLTAQDGTTRDADAIIFATGFHVTDMPLAAWVYGAAGVRLAEAWRPGMTALRGTTVPGFPNLCLVIGPNTGLGHNSLIHIIEAQLDYILDYLAQLDRTGAAALDTRPDAQQRWAAGIARRMSSTVWTTGGCTSWYLGADGRNPTLWPGSVRGFRQATRRVSLAEYQLIPSALPPGDPG